MNLEAVAAEIYARLDTIEELNCYLGPPGSISTPAGVIVLPDDIEFDKTYGRGADKIVWPVLVLMSQMNDSGTIVGRASEYCSGSGPKSVKAVLEDPSYTYDSCDSVFVAGAKLDTVTWGKADYSGALFELHIFGSGS